MKRLRKVLMVFLSLVLVAGYAVTGDVSKASAAAKTYNAYISVYGSNFSVGDGGKSNHCKIKNKKGKKKYTITLKSTDSLRQPAEGEKANLDIVDVFIEDILKDHDEKDIKISNVVVKCDGKKVKLNKKEIESYAQKGEDDTYRYCICIYYAYGSTTMEKGSFDFQDEMTISFKINIKK